MTEQTPAPELVRCTMGVGCDEAGVCYAEAHGQPEQCPKRHAAPSAPDGLVERSPDAPAELYGAIGVAMFKADFAGLRIDQAINMVGNAAFDFFRTRPNAEMRRVVEAAAKVAEDKVARDQHGNLAWWCRDHNSACRSIAAAIRAIDCEALAGDPS